MNKCLIYKITNKLNGKSYIGKSMEYRFKHRIKQHKNDNSNTHFARAKRKYGFDNFEISIIEKGIDKNEISNKEKYWIKYFDTFNNGYNSTIGGEGGNTFSKRTKQEMELTSLKISNSIKGCKNGNKGQYVGNKNPMYGKRHSDETKKKMSESLKKRRFNIKCKVCEKEFISRSNATKYCSDECRKNKSK